MADALDHGITVTEIAAMDQPIDVSAESVAVFAGRTLRGPVGQPVAVSSWQQFRRRFGGAWRRSGLPDAVRDFFEHGGQSLFVIRVASNARGAMLCLPAGGAALVLRALEPGSTENLRAAVDFDGIDDDDCFNLVLQRLDPDSGVLMDQELHGSLSIDEASDRFVGDVLASSSMARLEHPYPSHRPDETGSDYVDAVQAGHDGSDLADYDLVGNRDQGTGLFALGGIDQFDILYLPAPGPAAEPGATALLAAELYCRQRGAMLVVDPPAAWQSVDDAVTGMRELGFASPNMLGYYPRLQPRRASEMRAAGGALAGLLCRHDREHGPWQPMEASGYGFAPRLPPAVGVDETAETQLGRAGLNAIVNRGSRRAILAGDRTMGRGNESHTLYAGLSTRRSVLRIVNLIDRATRWAVFERPDTRLLDQLHGRLSAFLSCLSDLEAFDNDEFTLECDVLTQGEGHVGLSIDLGFTPRGAGTPVYLTLQQSADGLRVVDTAFARQIS